MTNTTPATTGRTSPAPLTELLLRGQTARTLATLEHHTIQRIASIRAESAVQREKIDEVDSLTREAMTGHVFIRRWADTLAGPDPLLADELRFFTDMARIGKGEIIADTIDSFCRESRS